MTKKIELFLEEDISPPKLIQLLKHLHQYQYYIHDIKIEYEYGKEGEGEEEG